MTAGERIKDLRLDKRLTQQKVADYLGINRPNYSKYEAGKLEFNHDMLIKLAKLFNVRTDYILGLED